MSLLVTFLVIALFVASILRQKFMLFVSLSLNEDVNILVDLLLSAGKEPGTETYCESLLKEMKHLPDTGLVCLTNRRNRSYYRNEIGLPCSAAPISGDDQIIPVAVPRERDGAYSEKNQGGHVVLSEMSCPGVTNSSDGGDPTRYEFPRHSGCDAAGRSLALPFVAGRHGFSICIRDDMRRCRRENCDDSRGGFSQRSTSPR